LSSNLGGMLEFVFFSRDVYFLDNGPDEKFQMCLSVKLIV